MITRFNKSHRYFGLEPSQIETINKMFFGPYLPEWRDEKGIVDNTDLTIAKRLGIHDEDISAYLRIVTEQHFERIYHEAMEREREISYITVESSTNLVEENTGIYEVIPSVLNLFIFD